MRRMPQARRTRRRGKKKTSGSNLSAYSNWIHTRKYSVGKHLNLLFGAKKSQPSMEEKNATRIRKRNVDISPSKDQKKGVEQQSVKLGFRHPKKDVLAEKAEEEKSGEKHKKKSKHPTRRSTRSPLGRKSLHGGMSTVCFPRVAQAEAVDESLNGEMSTIHFH